MNYAIQKQNLSVPFGTEIPQSFDLEAVVLGSILIERDVTETAFETIRGGYFYDVNHRTIFRALKKLYVQNKSIDLVTVAEQLRQDKNFKKIGGLAKLASLTHNVSTCANFETHVGFLNEFYLKRKLIAASNQIRDEVFSKKDTFEIVDLAEKLILDVADDSVINNTTTMTDCLVDYTKELEGPWTAIDGVASGLANLDKLTYGWQRGSLNIIAARPGMGKTSLLLALARNAAVDHEKPAAVFSLEMSRKQLVNRMVASDTGLPLDKLKQRGLGEKDWEKFYKKTSQLAKSPIYFDDTAGLSLLALRAKARRLKRDHNIQLIVVDYLQLMQGDGSSLYEKISHISQGLKALAKELDIAVVAASQLSRAVEARGGDKIPLLSDLRDSGNIEQDADTVIFIHRPEYYGFNVDSENIPAHQLANLYLAKNRHGKVAKVAIRFEGEYSRFSDFAENQF